MGIGNIGYKSNFTYGIILEFGLIIGVDLSVHQVRF